MTRHPLPTTGAEVIVLQRSRIPWLIASVFTGAFFVLVLAIVAFEARFADRVYPGVYVDGLAVGGLTPAQVEVLLRERITYYRDVRIPLRYRDRSWEATPQELGASLDVQSIGAEVLAVGRGGQPWEDLAEQYVAIRRGWNVAVVTAFDQDAATAYLMRIAREIDRPARDAELRIVGTQVETSAGQIGLRLDVAATREAIQNRVLRQSRDPVDLVVQEIPPVLPDVAETRTQVERMLAGPVTMRFENQSWRLTPAEIAPMIMLSRQPAGGGSASTEGRGREKLVASLDEGKVRTFVESIAPQITQEPQDARVTWDTQAGRLAIKSPSVDGRKLNVDETVRRLIAQATSTDRTVMLAVDIQRPAVTADTLDQLGIKELVAQGTTWFAGSPAGRIQNIRVAASKFQDVLVPPDGIFSFGEHLGDVSAKEGYAEAYIIRGGRTELDYGGGVCQVSTTAFRAAFFGGFPIVERWPHAYRVQWYEKGFGPGLDATVFTPQVDFKFKNDTGAWLLIQTSVDTKAGSLTFRFYGTKPDRQVTWEGPFISNVTPAKPPVYQLDPKLAPGEVKQVDWAHQGADVVVRRVVKQGDKVLYQDTFFSRYRPWGDVFLVGPKPEGKQASAQ